MQRNNDTAGFAPQDVAAALGLLSRLPVPVDGDAAIARSAAAVWAYPVAGLVIGAIAATTASFALWVGLAPPIAAGLVLACQIIITGAMHEDGLADSCDGLWGGWTKERRLEIMKDSRIGTYGVLALGLSLLIRWAALTVILTAGQAWAVLPATSALSRSVMPVVMAGLPAARDNGLSRSVGRPAAVPILTGLGIAAVLALATLGWFAFVCFAIAALCAVGCGRIAQAKIGGQTGDILGATQQVTEIACLCALSVAA